MSAERLKLTLRKRRILPKGAFFRCGLALLAFLTACTPKAAPEEADQPTAPATQTIEQPSPTVESPTQEPTTEPTTEPTPDSPYGHWTATEATTIRVNASEEKVQEALEKLEREVAFPLSYDSLNEVYVMNCLLEEINFLKEGHYINFGDFDVRVTGQCSYLDANGEKQTVTVALAIQNTTNNTTWFPHNGIIPFRFSPSRIQEAFPEYTKIVPGMAVVLAIGLSQPQHHDRPGANHNKPLINGLYNEDQFEKYAETGSPEDLNYLIVPLSLVRADDEPLVK